MNKYLRSSILVLFLLIPAFFLYRYLSTTIERLINKNFPETDYADIQRSSLQENQQIFDQFGSPEVSVNIGASDPSSLLDSAFTRNDSIALP
ncbi:MAG TPA: hypothetical protein VGM41_00005, partial [Chitinophagaceae bacterium]